MIFGAMYMFYSLLHSSCWNIQAPLLRESSRDRFVKSGVSEAELCTLRTPTAYPAALSRLEHPSSTVPRKPWREESILGDGNSDLYTHSQYHFGAWEVAMEADYDEVSNTTLAFWLAYHYGGHD